MNLFQIQQIKFPILTRFAFIIHSVTPLQTDNERYFSLAGIYTASCRANISFDILSGFLFINRKSSALGRNTTIDVFGGSLDVLFDILDDMESNLDAFADASDNE